MRRAPAAVALIATVLIWTPACGAARATLNSGVRGHVVAGPTCPVQRVPPQPGCAPRPLAATLQFRRVGARRATTVRSSANGAFSVRLAAGDYVLRALPHAGSPLPRPPAPMHVRVRVGRYTSVTVSYDSGIR